MANDDHSKIIARLKEHYPDARYYLNFSNPLELMVAAILSAQVRDEVVNEATKTLFKRYKTAKDYANADLKEFEKEISKITFFRNKAKNVKEACRILIEKYNGNVPRKMEELTKLPGIARKTANVILSNAYDVIEGIPVDTHYIRVAYRLGWTKSTNPVVIEKDSMNIIDKKYWKELPWLLKAHGKAICKAPYPYCSKCFLNEECPKQGVTKKL